MLAAMKSGHTGYWNGSRAMHQATGVVAVYWSDTTGSRSDFKGHCRFEIFATAHQVVTAM